jgi:hypothetical protein
MFAKWESRMIICCVCMHAYDLIKIVVKCTLNCAKNYLIV